MKTNQELTLTARQKVALEFIKSDLLERNRQELGKSPYGSLSKDLTWSMEQRIEWAYSMADEFLSYEQKVKS